MKHLRQQHNAPGVDQKLARVKELQQQLTVTFNHIEKKKIQDELSRLAKQLISALAGTC